jgi:spore coat protein JB
MDRDRYMKLKEIQEIEFVLIELNLYLDTHPEDERALLEYNTYGKKLKTLISKYECLYGPLVNFGFSPSHFPFRWVEEPWPWDM